MNDIAPGSRFFYTGGALPPEAPSYILRSADDQLFERLQKGDYCYVLVSRQMGKSSLMVHTLTRLVQQNVTAVMVDLNSIGDDTTQEQWYYSLTEQLASQLDLNEPIDALWDRSEGKTSLQKWVGALELLLRLHPDRSLVIFVDEIDQVRSLPFKTDEFFAGIRSFHNRRAMDANFKRLTFCLIGVALPSDLIEDPRITPFNIAERIDLTDFTEDQVVALKVGLQREEVQDEALLQRVFYWTNGHPYLTQRLCRAIVEDPSIQMSQDVDTLCGRLFFGADAATPDDNINLVGTRLLHSHPDVMSLLTLYQRIAQGKRVPYDKANRMINVLVLAGALRSVSGSLQIRNRIYARVFDTKWIADNMPDAEVRLQRQAYRRGVLRALSVASVVIAIMGFLLYHTFRSDRASLHALNAANRELYVASMSLAQKAYSEGNILRVQQLLEECRSKPGLTTYRGFEWRYLWGLIHQDRYTLVDHASNVMSVAFSSEGQTVVTVDLDATIRRWTTETGHKTEAFAHQYSQVTATAISFDARIVGIATVDKMVRLHSSASGSVLCSLSGFKRSVGSLAFSQDGRYLAAGDFDGTVTLWRIANGALLRTFPGHGALCTALAFSTNGKALFASNSRGVTWIRDAFTGHTVANLKRDSGKIQAAAFSPDGRILATGAFDGRVFLRDVVDGAIVNVIPGHSSRVMALAFSSDGRTLATASADGTAKLWNVASGEPLRTLVAHSDCIQCVAFSLDGRMLATGSDDRSTKLWDLATTHTHQLGPERPSISCVGFAPDGRTAAISGPSGRVELWNIATGRLLTALNQKATALAFGHDGRTLITADSKGMITANDLQRQNQWALFHSTKGVWALDLSPITNEAAIGSEEGLVHCIDTRTGNRIRIITTHLSGTAELAFSPDGKLLAVSDKGESGILVDYPTGRILLNFSRPGVQCFSLCFSPDSQKMAVGFSDGTVELWNSLADVKEWSVFGHVGAIFALAFSPDGNNLVTGGDDHKVHLWNVRIGREVWTFEGHRDSICGLNFTPDGRSLVSIDQGRTAIRWPAPAWNAIPAPTQ